MLMRVNEAEKKFHHLAQFLAAFSNSYLPKAENDSQSNMEWSFIEKSLISRRVDNIYLCLDFRKVILKAVKERTVETLDLLGLTHSDIDAWLRKVLSGFGLDVSAFHYDLGFSLDTPFDNFITLDAEDDEAIAKIISLRKSAQKSLTTIQKKHEKTSHIRVWPHHFDTGMLIDKSEEQNFSKGIGLGYAIADHVSDVPYFYVYSWPDHHLNYDMLPTLRNGMWINEDWKGALLTVNMLHNTGRVTAFYTEAVSCFVKNLKKL